MKFVHTSDWHLGKSLEGYSRLEEQKLFIDDFVDVVKKNDVDMVIIAGDIYDTYNPSAQAEKLFYKAVTKLADNGRRCVVVISGNHDNPDRLTAAIPLAHEQGILIFGKPSSTTEIGEYKNFDIVAVEEGFTRIKIRDEFVNLMTLPYPSEKRLNEVIFENENEEKRQISYSQKIGELFSNLGERIIEDSINIAVSHVFVDGGESTESERPIQLGGALTVNKKDLPQNVDYIALGHLHKSQKASQRLEAYYSGSPVVYSKDERNYKKSFNLVELRVGQSPVVEKVLIKNYKPVEVFKCKGIEEAIKACENNKYRDIWAFFEIETDEVISKSSIKKMKELLKDIIEIKPVLKVVDYKKNEESKEKSMAEIFKDFYIFKRGIEPKGELMNLFLDIINEEGDR